LVCGGLRHAHCHVAHVYDRAIDGLDRQIIESANRAGQIVQVHRVFELAYLLRPNRGDEVLDRQGVDNVIGGDAWVCRAC
jgi:hypothetical protein